MHITQKGTKFYHSTPWNTLEGPFDTEKAASDSFEDLSQNLSIEHCITNRHRIRIHGTELVGTCTCTNCNKTYDLTAVLNAYLRRMETRSHP